MMDGKLVISVEGDMEKRLIDCDKNVFKKLKPGFQIGVLPPTMEVLEILPNLEVKSLLLGEKPNVTYGEIGGSWRRSSGSRTSSCSRIRRRSCSRRSPSRRHAGSCSTARRVAARRCS